MRNVIMKITRLTLAFILLSGILAEAGEGARPFPASKSGRDGSGRFIYQAGGGPHEIAKKPAGHENKGAHRHHDHRDEDEEALVPPASAYIHSDPAPYLLSAAFSHPNPALYFRICCRSNNI